MHGDEPKGDEREGEDRGEGDEPDSDDSTPRRCEPSRRRRRECCGRVASAHSLVYSIVGTLRYSLVAHERNHTFTFGRLCLIYQIMLILSRRRGLSLG